MRESRSLFPFRCMYVVSVGIVLTMMTMDSHWANAQSSAKPFSLTISTDLSPFKAGSNVFVRVTETNTSDAVINCSVRDTNGIDLSFDYSVWDPSGQRLEPRRDAEDSFGSMRVCRLKPRASFSGEQLISWLYNMNMPGQYRVQVSRTLSDEPGALVIKSNTIVVDVSR